MSLAVRQWAVGGLVVIAMGCGSNDPDTASAVNGQAGVFSAGTAGNGTVAGTVNSGASGTSAQAAAAVGGGTSGQSANVAGAGVDGTGAVVAGRAAVATGGAGGNSAAAGSGTATAGRSAAGSGGRTAGAGGSTTAAGAGGSTGAPTEKFSFFVTSLEAMRKLSGNDQGFGGDLRFKQSSGLAGADKICTDIAESSMPGAGKKTWRAFLSTQAGGANGGPVHASERIGNGPWYDRTGRVVAMNLSALLNTRPGGADAAIANDLPNELGVPNHGAADVDNHDTVTGSNAQGQFSGGSTCADWTSTQTPTSGTAGSGGGRPAGGGHNGPMCGHSWPAQSGQSWIQAHAAPGCAPSVSLVQTGGGSGDGIGNGGGYGGIYCFALTP